MRNGRRGELSIEMTFLIFLAVVVVMIIITLIIKFSFSGSNMFCKIAGTCNKDIDAAPDNQIINVTNCGALQNELVKHAKLCYERVIENSVRDVSLCYTILSPGACGGFTAQDIEASLFTEGINATMFADPLTDTKMVVSFLRRDRAINII